MSEQSEDSVGRPTKYDKKYNDQVYKLCLLGATDKELADFFEVAESTINLWKLKQEQFSESIKKGKMEADANVADKLYKRANGYQYTEEQTEFKKGDEDPVKKTITKKTIAPDVTAQIFWLKNRQPKLWRDRSEVEVDDKTPRTPEERKARIAELKKKLNEPDK